MSADENAADTDLMAVRGNCLLAAVAHVLLGSRIRFMRNRRGRWHAYWVDPLGRAFEFHAKGASGRTYWQNRWATGAVRRCPALDE